MLVGDLQTTLTPEELEYGRRHLGREPNALEWAMIDAEWSEHCSYKSSKTILTQLPTTGKRVLLGPGFDSGVVDIGDGYVLSLHIESHNHPSAIEPYGGAATGIGGVVRDILCMGNTPIALLDSLRFGDITKSDHSKWIMKHVIRGIADYGNCIGVPTVAGEVEFDECFEANCLVDVACLGVGRKDELLLAQATHPGDSVYLIGGSTGRDGIHGSTFASRTLTADSESDRSAVQIPDPFTKKLIMEATLESNNAGLLRGCKDLGGGGLATGLSEIADKGGTGLDIQLETIPIREADMTPIEILISESQERMLLVTKQGTEQVLHDIMRKYGVSFARIATVTSTGTISILNHGKLIASLPTSFLANAPIIQRNSRIPQLRKPTPPLKQPIDIHQTLLALLASPTITSKEWVYRQYDHEVGIRTVAKPGEADAAVMKLPNGKLAAIKVDGNSRLCNLDPYIGAASVLAECCRNVIAVGAEPIAFLDHCQFGDPNDEEIFWSFSTTVKALADFAKAASIPCVGGKVSFYNQDEVRRTAIKSSPVLSVLGLIEQPEHVTKIAFKDEDDSVISIGPTEAEMGGSEFNHLLGIGDGEVPRLDFELEIETQRSVLECIRKGLVTACHDCSKGGIGAGLARMAVAGNRGAKIDLRKSGRNLADHELLFSESNSRFLLTTNKPTELIQYLSTRGIPSADVGRVTSDALLVKMSSTDLVWSVDALRDAYCNSLQRILEPWQK